TGAGSLNFVMARGGDDNITGGTGTDFIAAGTGDDTINSGDGQDFVSTDDFNPINGTLTSLANSGAAAAGNDTINLGAGDDFAAVGSNLQATDQIDGGTGTDYVVFTGDYATTPLVLGASTLTNVEYFILSNDYDYNITLHDNTFTGATATIQGGGLGSSDVLTIDASLETSTAINITSGAADDTIFGGSGNDTIFGGHGDDYLKGKGGGDTLTGHYGADTLQGGGGKDILIGAIDNNGTYVSEEAAGGAAVSNIYKFSDYSDSDWSSAADNGTWDVIKGFDDSDKIQLTGTLNDNFNVGNSSAVLVKASIASGTWSSNITEAGFFYDGVSDNISIAVITDGTDARLYVDANDNGNIDATDFVVKFIGLGNTTAIDN
ncbi:MAG TPA: calcium-binding protein, partial [Piscirickettsiaceae bacterium]|nr:calcium-binding protein [Piscirickettsiaceae bacterium]